MLETAKGLQLTVDEMDQNIQRAREVAQEAALTIIEQFEDDASPTEESMLNLLHVLFCVVAVVSVLVKTLKLFYFCDYLFLIKN